MSVYPSDPTFLSLRGFDPALLDQGVADNAVAHHTQLGRGRLDAELARVPFVNGTLHSVQQSRDLRTQGEFARVNVTVVVGLEIPSRTTVLGREVGRDAVIAFGPGTVVDNVEGAGIHWVSLSFPATAFVRTATALTGRECVPDGRPTLVQSPERDAVLALRSVIGAMTRMAREQPLLFRDERWRGNAERGLQGAYLGALLGAPASARQPVTLEPHRCGVVVRAVDDYLDATGGGIVPIAELCRAARVPRRTLERAFQSTFDIGPGEYMRRRALNAVHRALLAESEGLESVAAVAIRHGFWHLGRFAAYYRNLFGESPSATLHRRRAAVRRSNLPLAEGRPRTG